MALPSNNNTISAELQERIAKEATDYANALTFNSAWINPIRLAELKVTAAEDWKAGATEYAIWKAKYDELKAENERLKQSMATDALRGEYGLSGSKYAELLKEHAALKAQAQRMVDALGQLLSRFKPEPYNGLDKKALLVVNKALSEWNGEKEGEG